MLAQAAGGKKETACGSFRARLIQRIEEAKAKAVEEAENPSNSAVGSQCKARGGDYCLVNITVGPIAARDWKKIVGEKYESIWIDPYLYKTMKGR